MREIDSKSDKSNSKDIYNVTTDFRFYAFQLYIHQRIIKQIMVYTKDIKQYNWFPTLIIIRNVS